ncbi:tripartite tricarboxylate transporter permease [Nonomuraea sp. NPDC049750]|uniref:tripartite tricarboxylate transporter permease n=1 Tax=Nonomuraea sp. NPDC049750 TaxID=3154738 RepID=UPI0033E12630
MLVPPFVVSFAISLGGPDYFAIMLLAFVAVGIFAVGEALWVAAHLRRKAVPVVPVGRPWMGAEDWRRSWKPWLRGTALGFPFGALPAGGAELPTFLSYATEKRPEEFGHGASSSSICRSRPCGPGCCASRAPTCTRASCSSPPWAPMPSMPSRST